MSPTRYLLICDTLADGRSWAAEHPGWDFKLVPMRSPSSARGLTAFGITWTPMAKSHPRFDEVLDECMPALLASGRVIDAKVVAQ